MEKCAALAVKRKEVECDGIVLGEEESFNLLIMKDVISWGY